jgi:hypothetical protein
MGYPRDVRFSPDSGHIADASAWLKRASSGLMRLGIFDRRESNYRLDVGEPLNSADGPAGSSPNVEPLRQSILGGQILSE